MEEIIKDKKKIRIYFSLLVTVICIIGVSYAFFQLFLKQSDNNTLVSRTCFDTSLTENTEKIVLENAYPIVDSEGLKGTPFTFTLKNNCSSYIRLYITIDSEHRGNLGTKYLDDNYIKVNISPKGTTSGQSVVLGSKKLTDLDNNRKGYIIINTGLQANEEKSFDLRLWMDENVTLDQGLGKSWEGKIVVIGEASNGMTLNEAILADNEVREPLTTPGSEVSAHTLNDVENIKIGNIASSYKSYYITYGTGWEANGDKFNLTGTTVTDDTYSNSYSDLVGKYLAYYSLYWAGSSAAGTMKTTTNLYNIYYVVSATTDSFTYKPLGSNKNVTEALLASTEDDYGTSYYFRGAVKNNYVQFANKCWRIVRIVGDGSIKLVLHNDNTANASNPCSSVNNDKIAAFAYYSSSNFYVSEFNSSVKDNSSLGFMYGATDAGDYASTHENTNKSKILKSLETWYSKSLALYEDKLADTIWCNDKSTKNGELGYGTNDTNYNAYVRLRNLNTPSLVCPDDNNGGKLSKFTVSDTINGNGDLTYKIGLLTADEIAFSGLIAISADGHNNYSTFLQENTGNSRYWSMSPFLLYYGTSRVATVTNGHIDSGGSVNGNSALRPAISLVSDTEISGGSGTSEDPYVVK